MVVVRWTFFYYAILWLSLIPPLPSVYAVTRCMQVEGTATLEVCSYTLDWPVYTVDIS